MWKAEDLTGMKFGHLIVVRRNGRNNQNRAMWLCKCDCGNEKTIASHDLKHGTISCGCVGHRTKLNNLSKGWGWNKGITKPKELKKKRAYSSYKGYRRIKNIFRNMKDRCYNPQNKRYKDYGGRGIVICEEWLCKVDTFIEWAVKNGYDDTLSIDRIDNNLGYFPNNCRWTTRKVQQNNMRRNRNITYAGVTRTVTQWSEVIGVKPGTITTRLSRGWNIEQSLFGK